MVGMIGRKLGMMRLYDGAGRARAVTVIELGPNRVTQLRTPQRDGYEAVQVGFTGNRKRVNRPERGHLRAAGVDDALSVLQEFPLNGETYERGQTLTVEIFTPGQYVTVAGVSKGRGFAGGVKRWNFHGGPKTHGQSDRHRAPGSVGAGTTPGKVWKGQKMAGHMGHEAKTIVNLLVVLTDPARNLIFVQGSVPGADEGIVTVQPGRRPPLKDYTPPVLHVAAPAVEDFVAPVVVDEDEEAGTPAEGAEAAEQTLAEQTPAEQTLAEETPAEGALEGAPEPGPEGAATGDSDDTADTEGTEDEAAR